MPEKSTVSKLSAIDLSVAHRLRDPDFRREWFRAELEGSVPEAFKDLRERRALTQGQLATAMGTKQPAISRFEASTEAVWEFQFLLRMAESMDARLRVVIDAAEDVIAEYEDAEQRQAQSGSALDDFGSVMIHQDLKAANKFREANNLGKQDAASEYRGFESGLSGWRQSARGTTIRARRDGFVDQTIQLSALSR